MNFDTAAIQMLVFVVVSWQTDPVTVFIHYNTVINTWGSNWFRSSNCAEAWVLVVFYIVPMFPDIWIGNGFMYKFLIRHLYTLSSDNIVEAYALLMNIYLQFGLYLCYQQCWYSIEFVLWITAYLVLFAVMGRSLCCSLVASRCLSCYQNISYIKGLAVHMSRLFQIIVRFQHGVP